MEHPRIPTSTYRLQFNRQFTFAQAREIVPYLNALGISDCYASPYFQARAESLHGYDITDHNKLNAAIGSREEYDAWVADLHAHGMGQIVDFVPNHMGRRPLSGERVRMSNTPAPGRDPRKFERTPAGTPATSTRAPEHKAERRVLRRERYGRRTGCGRS